MSDIAKMAVILSASAAGFTAGMKQATRDIDGFSQHIGSATSILAKFGAGFSAFEAFHAFEVQEQSVAKLDAVLAATGETAGFTSQELQQIAADLQRVTTFGDETTIAATAMLATFKNIKGDNFKATIVAAQNLSTVMGTDLQSATVALGKALNDPAEGLSRLSRIGVQFTEEQASQIKAMEQVGNMAGAQATILADLAKRYGGAAEAIGNTFSGKVQQAKNALGDLGEVVGGQVAPVIVRMAEAIKSGAEWASRHSAEIRILAKSLLSVIAAITAYRLALKVLAEAQKAAAAAQALANSAEGPYGWLKLAGGAIVAGVSVWGVNKAFDSFANESSHTAVAANQVAMEVEKIGKMANEAAAEGQKLTSTLADMERELQIQIVTVGWSAEGVKLYKLALGGATDGQIAHIRALQSHVDWLKAHKETMDADAETAKRYWEETRTDAERYEAKLKDIQRLEAKGVLSADIADRARRKLADQKFGPSGVASRFNFGAIPTTVAAIERRSTIGFELAEKDKDRQIWMELSKTAKLQYTTEQAIQKAIEKQATVVVGRI